MVNQVCIRFTFTFLVLSVFHCITSFGQDEHEKISVELELNDFDIIDRWDEVSRTTKYAILDRNLAYEEKMKAEKDYGNLLRNVSESAKAFTDVPQELLRNWTLQSHSGDGLLKETDWNRIVEFHNKKAEQSYDSKVPCVNNNGTANCTVSFQDFLDILGSSKNLTALKQIWESRQDGHGFNATEFVSILNLVNSASRLNDEHGAQSYWEMLSEYPDGYQHADDLWREIEPFYEKLHKFVKTRLYSFYNLSDSDEIPVYLLGSEFGIDWTNIAETILPQPQLYHDVVNELRYLTTKELYKLVEKSLQPLKLSPLGPDFWRNSVFNFSRCGPYVIDHCDKGVSEVITCKKLGLSDYFNAHEAVLKMILVNHDYYSLPRRHLRYSAIDEALESLGPLLAVNNLPRYKFINESFLNDYTDETYSTRMTALLLVALRTLPKLPFYLAADRWRLNELRFGSNDVPGSWWTTRRQMQKVNSITGKEPDFIGDPYITSNKPYLSKFLGTILSFQIADYYAKYYSNDRNDLITSMSEHYQFLSLINERSTRNWPELLNNYLGFDGISAQPLLEYFQPLEEYFEKAPQTQSPYSTTQRTVITTSTSTTIKPKPERKKSKFDRKSPKNVTEPPTPILAANETKKDEGYKNVENSLDQDSLDLDNNRKENMLPHKAEIFIAIGVLVCITIFTVLFVLRKKLRRKRKGNNRRFET